MLRRLNPVTFVKRKVAEAYQRRRDLVVARLDQITVPARFQGTVVEHWAKYWKYLIKDYFTVLFGILKDAKNRPLRAMVIGGTATAVYKLSEVNPTAQDYHHQLTHYCNELGSLPESLQNSKSRDYLRELTRLESSKTLRRLNLGVASIFWRHDHNPELKTYQAISKYVGVSPADFRSRIVDVGFLGRLWALESNMRDYDVNTD